MCSFSTNLRIAAKAAFFPRALPTTSTRPSFKVMMGQMPRMLATRALVAESRPPIFKYFRSSIMANSRMRGISSSTFSAISAPVMPASRIFTASSTSSPKAKVTFNVSGSRMFSAPRMFLATRADCKVPLIFEEMNKHTTSSPLSW